MFLECFRWSGLALNDFRVFPLVWDGFDCFWSVSPPSGADSRVSIGLGWP